MCNVQILDNFPTFLIQNVNEKRHGTENAVCESGLRFSKYCSGSGGAAVPGPGEPRDKWLLDLNKYIPL